MIGFYRYRHGGAAACQRHSCVNECENEIHPASRGAEKNSNADGLGYHADWVRLSSMCGTQLGHDTPRFPKILGARGPYEDLENIIGQNIYKSADSDTPNQEHSLSLDANSTFKHGERPPK